jgi:hypothetical protein
VGKTVEMSQNEVSRIDGLELNLTGDRAHKVILRARSAGITWQEDRHELEKPCRVLRILPNLATTLDRTGVLTVCG